MRLHQERGCLTSPSLNLVEKRRWATLLGPYKSNKQTQPQQPEASSNESKKVPDRWKLSNLKARAFLVGLVPRPTLRPTTIKLLRNRQKSLRIEVLAVTNPFGG